MKTLKFCLCIPFAALLFSSCSKVSDDKSEISSEKMTVSAAINDITTKTSIDGVDVKWSSGDAIAIFSNADPSIKKEFSLTSGAGEKKAIFSGDVIEGEKFVAVFPASSAKYSSNTGPSVRITTPEEQTYVENGIAQDLLPMLASGTSLQNMDFQYLGGILRIKLYATDDSQISSVAFTPNSPNQAARYVDFNVGSRWGETYPYGAVPSENSYILNCPTPVALSTDPANPTIFNIVYGNGFVCNNGFSVTITTSTNKKMVLAKSGSFTFSKGKIYSFNAKAFEDNTTSSNKLISIDGNSEITLYNCTDIPTNSIKVKTINGEKLNSADIEHIIQIAESASVALDIDLSESEYTSETLCLIKSNSIKSFKLPSNITILANSAFSGCRNLMEIDLTGVKTINTYAFDYCALTTIHIPASVTIISNNWISYYSSKVTAFTVADANAYFKAIDGVLFSKDGTLLKEYPRAKTGTAYTIPDGTQKIQNYAFHLTEIENLTIPASVTTINSCATNKIKYIKCLGNTPASFEGKNLPNNGTLEVPTGTGETYKEAWSWLETKGWTVSDGTSPSPAVAKIDDIPTIDINSEGFWN